MCLRAPACLHVPCKSHRCCLRVIANAVSSPMLCHRQCCVIANAVSSPMLCHRQCCVVANAVSSPMLCHRQCCVVANAVSSPMLCRRRCLHVIACAVSLPFVVIAVVANIVSSLRCPRVIANAYSAISGSRVGRPFGACISECARRAGGQRDGVLPHERRLRQPRGVRARIRICIPAWAPFDLCTPICAARLSAYACAFRFGPPFAVCVSRMDDVAECLRIWVSRGGSPFDV